MRHIWLTFQQHLLTKAIVAALIMICCVGGMILASLWAFRHIERLFLALLEQDGTHITANASFTSDLSQVFTETHQLLSTFIDRPAELHEQGKALLTRLDRYTAPSPDADAAGELSQALQDASAHLRAVLDQCAAINDQSRRLAAMQQELFADLTRLDDAVGEKMMTIVAEGRQDELAVIQQLIAMLPAYREGLLRIALLIAQAKSDYLVQPSRAEETARTQQFEGLVTELQTNLMIIATSGADLAALGQQLSDRVAAYQQALGNFHQALALFRTQIVPFNAAQKDFLTTLETQVAQTTATMKQTMAGAILSSRRIVIGLTLIILLILCGIGGYVFRSVAALTQIARVVGQIAHGDLACELPAMTARDEIGALADVFRAMLAQLTGVVRHVKAAVRDVTQHSQEMNAAAEQMSEGAAQQASATEEVSAAMEEMAANIRQTAENARLTEGIAVTSAEDARAGKRAVTEIIHAMEVIAERISVVQEIAGQTNMLSLNATIEAAKAQDYGKGFTVVASSVRDLARQTRTAADEIRTLVHSCVVLSAQAGDILQRLVPNSEKTAELVQEISASSQEQSTGVEHVNQAVQQLDSVTQQTAATAEEVAVTAESLTIQADALQQTMAFFTVTEAQPDIQMPAEDLRQRLQELEQQLAELRGAALPRPPKPSEARAAARDRASAPGNSTDADERDQEFEHY